MARSGHAFALCLAAFLIAVSPAVASGQSYCARLEEMRLMPFKPDETVDDEVYTGLMREGKAAVPCLLDRVSDTELMPDPRKAPFYGGFAVGDAAVMVLTDICGISLEQALPPEVLARYNTQGVYAYFAFVEGGRENRALIAKGLEAQSYP